jgi:transposase
MIPTSVRIFVCTERQDMRRSFDALALAVRERLALDPESASTSMADNDSGGSTAQATWGST